MTDLISSLDFSVRTLGFKISELGFDNNFGGKQLDLQEPPPPQSELSL